MKMVIGGAYAGKKDFVMRNLNTCHELCPDGRIGEEHIAYGESCSMQDALTKPLLNGLHTYIKRLMLEDYSLETFCDNLLKLNPKVTIITQEIGSGLVPIDSFERDYREFCGRICTVLAAESETVIRIVYGIPQLLKGSL